MISKINEQKYFSVPQVAKVLGMSRVAVLKKIKTNRLKAHKVGRNYIILNSDLAELMGSAISTEQQEGIEKAVKKAVKQYGITFRRLGRET